MVRKFLGACGLLAIGCSAPISADEQPVGTLEAPLTAIAPTGSIYRLNAATFDFLDHSGNRVARVQPAFTDATLSVALKPGNYTIVLLPGWALQRQVDNGWVDVHGQITAEPIGEFWIHPDETTALPYGFSAGFTTGGITDTTPPGFEGDVNPGSVGTALVSMAVDDCGLYVSKISSLAAFTIDCLGKLDATQYSKSTSGGLVRNFTSCTTGNAAALRSIDGVLSLQYDRPTLKAAFPKAARDIDINRSFSTKCIADAYESWRAGFLASGVNVCPTWQVSSVQNAPEVGASAVVGAGLPAYVTNKKTKIDTVVATAPTLVQMEKLGIVYSVAFAAGGPAPNCGTAAQCAVACAAGFKGFVLSTNGTTQVTADPAYWELGTVYPKADNPFLNTAYYHAMADYGPVPGDQFGHAQRAQAYQDSRGAWVGEACTYYLNGTRFWTKLIYNNNTTGAVGWCKPPL